MISFPFADELVCNCCRENIPSSDTNELLNHAAACEFMERYNTSYKFVCLKCDFHTAIRQRMSRHLFWHTGNKPFNCSYCEHRTNRKDHLQQHIKLKHGVQ